MSVEMCGGVTVIAHPFNLSLQFGRDQFSFRRFRTTQLKKEFSDPRKISLVIE
jgi:rRNA maturation protein Nop10